MSDGLLLNVLLPQKVLIRKNISSNGRLSLGSEMDNTSFYIYRSSRTYEFRQLEINSGAIYEHNFCLYFVGKTQWRKGFK
ncbi:hypothetical protein [Chryseobacterium phocaeense]|uniref:hypothetical protein n=1 Tax=Chryseobacterium phocaeense TaxID=1816690 RepID=UPI0009BAD571|nr:hypothetical protein [Chryseobacterium phocaeense]